MKKLSLLVFTIFITSVIWSQDHKCMSPVVTDGEAIKYIDSDYQLQDLPMAEVATDAYYFDPVEWKIGSDPEKNRVQLQAAIDHAKSISKGRTVFKMGACDFYIKCDGKRLNIHDSAQVYGVQLPSDFEVQMTSETFIRVAPNFNPSFAIFGIHKKKNIKIYGGNLIGDIKEHDYSKVLESHEYGAQILISGGKNITLENVTISHGTGDNVMIGDSSNRPEAHNFMYNSKITDFWRTENIIIRGCDISFAGRNNISILSGETMLIENNKIHSCSQINETPKAPSCGIDAEAYGWVAEDDFTHQTGNFTPKDGKIELERIENVTVINNHFYNNLGASMNMFTIFNSTFENNYCEEGVLAAYGSQIRIESNTFINRGTTRKEAQNGFANTALSYNIQGDRVKSEDIKITNNRFEGFPAAALVRNNNIQFNGNTLVNNKTGVVIGNSNNTRIYDNHIVSNVLNSKGITSQSATLNNVTLRDNYIDVDKYAIHLSNTNSDSIANYFKVNIVGNTINSKSFMQKVTGLNFKNNEVLEPMVIENLTNFVIKHNDFDVDGVAIRGYYSQDSGMICKNDFTLNSGRSSGIVLSHSNGQMMSDVTILGNDFIGTKASRLIQGYGDGGFSNITANIQPHNNNVKDYYKSLDFSAIKTK